MYEMQRTEETPKELPQSGIDLSLNWKRTDFSQRKCFVCFFFYRRINEHEANLIKHLSMQHLLRSHPCVHRYICI